MGEKKSIPKVEVKVNGEITKVVIQSDIQVAVWMWKRKLEEHWKVLMLHIDVYVLLGVRI